MRHAAYDDNVRVRVEGSQRVSDLLVGKETACQAELTAHRAPCGFASMTWIGLPPTWPTWKTAGYKTERTSSEAAERAFSTALDAAIDVTSRRRQDRLPARDRDEHRT